MDRKNRHDKHGANSSSSSSGSSSGGASSSSSNSSSGDSSDTGDAIGRSGQISFGNESRKTWDLRLVAEEAKNPLAITKWLENLRLEKLQKATWQEGKLFVDLFSGKRSPISRQVAKRGGACIAFDVLIDQRLDLENPAVEQVVMGWIKKQFIWGIWLGTDCTTWSRASYSKGPGWFNSYRPTWNVWGEEEKLSQKEKAKVLQGNIHAQFSIRVLQAVAKQPSVVAGMENPLGSVIWQLPELRSMEEEAEDGRSFSSICHYCQYGTLWKKPTKFLFVGGKKALAPCKVCKGSGNDLSMCSRTKKCHLKLGHGRKHPDSGKLLTSLATEYPERLAAQLVKCLAG